MVDDAVEDGLCPGGSPAILLQHRRCHTLLKGLEVKAVPLSICPALGGFFSETFLGNTTFRGDSVDLDIKPQL